MDSEVYKLAPTEQDLQARFEQEHRELRDAYSLVLKDIHRLIAARNWEGADNSRLSVTASVLAAQLEPLLNAPND